MDIFNRSEDEILFELIKKDNPDLVPELNPQNCYISSAFVNTDADSGQYNTVAVVIPRFNSGLSGKTTIKYNRINLEDLFRGMQPVKVSGNTASLDYATRAELPLLLSETYGLPIREGDVDASVSAAYYYGLPNVQYGQGIYRIANNKCFIGQITIAFSYDFSQSLSTLLPSGALGTVLSLPDGIGPIGEHYDWPSTWGFFGDVDFTEIVANVNTSNDLTFAQAQAIGTFVGRTFFDVAGAYDPNAHYDPNNPFAYYGLWKKHVAKDKTSVLVGTYPWIDTRYTHAKITQIEIDPSTGAALSVPHYFVFYFNWTEV